MKNSLVCAFLFAAACCQASITFSLDPTPQTVPLGSQATFTLDVSGLGDGTALGAYDLVIGYDDTVLSFDSVTFGTDLDPDDYGPVQFTLDTDPLELFEVSVDPAADLLSEQPDSFTIATIVFDTTATTVDSSLTLSENAISDQNGNDISGESVLNGATVTITGDAGGGDTPEPAPFALVAGGAAVLAWRRRQASETAPERRR